MDEHWEIILGHEFDRSKFDRRHSIEDHDHTEYDELDMIAQMNVDADKLANQYRQDHQPTIQHIIPLHDNTKIHIDLQGETITNHIKKWSRLYLGEK